MQKKFIVRLSIDERRDLESLVKTGRASARKIRHANILLKADVNASAWTDKKIAEAFNVHMNTVYTIRKRLVELGMHAALERKPREKGSTPFKLDGEGEACLITLSCSKPPEGYAKWTLRLLADKLVELEVVESISYETVRQTLKKTNLNLI